MNYETYQIMLYVLSFLAVIVFIALYFVKAGYGMFRTRSWGWSVPNKVGWVLMEAPVFIAMALFWYFSDRGYELVPLIFFIFFVIFFQGNHFSVPG